MTAGDGGRSELLDALSRQETERRRKAMEALRDPDDPLEQTSASPTLEARTYAEIEDREVDWILPGLLARGFLHLLYGAPGSGKSLVVVDLAARITKGGEWAGRPVPRGEVVLLASEDSPEFTVGPRFQAAGGDRSRLIDLPGFESIDRSAGALEDLLAERPGVSLVVLDTVGDFMGAAETNSYSEINHQLRQLIPVAEGRGVCVLLLHHTRRAGGLMGSQAFRGKVRHMAYLEGAGGCGTVRVEKSNLAQAGERWAFRIRQHGAGQPVVEWTADVDPAPEPGVDGHDEPPGQAELDAAIFGEPDPQPRKAKTLGPDAWLRGALARGPVESSELERLAKAQGIAAATLKRARKRIGARAVKGRAGWTVHPPE